MRFKVETVAGNLEVPWAMVFAPDGRLIFNERPGRVCVIENGTLRPQPLITIQDVEQTGESGLMGLTLHPKFAQNHWLYLAYAYKDDGQRVRVVRFTEGKDGLSDRRVIIENIPAGRFHAGTALGFGPDGALYISTSNRDGRGRPANNDDRILKLAPVK